MPALRRLVPAALAAGFLLVPASPARAQQDDVEDQVVLSGAVVVPRGQAVGEVVVLRGRVRVEGVGRGDVVVVDGPIEVLGQVSGSVIAVNGSVVLGPGAQVGGDVLAGGRVTAEAGAQVDGRTLEHVRFSLRGSLRVLGRLLVWAAVTVSALLLGLLLLLLAPRGADAVFEAARSAPWASAGWGLAVALALPLLAALAVLSVLALPLGLATLLALALVYSVGYAWAAWALGRALVRSPRNRALAFLAGWAILRAVGAVPIAGGVTWGLGAVFGLGAATVAVWRSRRRPGKHRAGQVPPPAGPGEQASLTAATGQE